LKDLFFCHIHVPKTGGTSFTKVLQRNFGEQYEPFEGLWTSVLPKLTPEQVALFVRRFPGITAVSSHQLSVALPFETASRRIVAIAFVRDPVERFFSYYFHMRHKYGVKHFSKETNLDEYIELIIKEGQYKPRSILRFMTGNKVDDINDYEKIEYLVKNKFLYLLPTNRMKESLEILKEDFPEYFNDIEVSKENISKRDSEIKDIHIKNVKKICSKFCYKLIDLANDLVDRNLTNT